MAQEKIITLSNLSRYDLNIKKWVLKNISEIDFSLLSIKVVDVKPEAGEANIIYLVKADDNKYEEWVYTDEAWHQLGTFDGTQLNIDLENYYKKNEVYSREEADYKFAKKSEVEDFITSEDLDEKLESSTTITEIIEQISEIDGSIKTIKVNSLPVEDIKQNAIYLVGEDIESGVDVYIYYEDEGKWVQLNGGSEGDNKLYPNQDLANYLMKSEAEEVYVKKSEIEELLGQSFVTEEDLTSKLAEYYSKEEVDKIIEQIEVTGDTRPDATEQDIDDLFDGEFTEFLATKEDINALFMKK